MQQPRQLLLDLKLQQTPLLENFVAGGNVELLTRLRCQAKRSSFDNIYLWGSRGSGKSHLLSAMEAATAGQRPYRLIHARNIHGEITPEPGSLLAIDDVHELDAEAQIVIFRLINATRFLGLSLLLSGAEPPLRLSLREDLRTRIGQMLIYEVQPLSDDEKSAALKHHAAERGMSIDSSVLDYLLRHGRRDLLSLMATLDALDQISMEKQRPPTMPLLRELMQAPLPL